LERRGDSPVRAREQSRYKRARLGRRVEVEEEDVDEEASRDA
jgi:hypothetical protein